MIKRIVKMTFREDRADAFLAVFEENHRQIRQFPGCQKLELLRCTKPDNIFFTYSYWDDTESLERYRQSDLFRRTWSQAKALFADKPAAWTVEGLYSL